MSLTPQRAMDPNLPRIWIQPHYGSFNGLRAIAVLSVFFMHYGAYWGMHLPRFFLWTGVDLFFVLSGFLITGILYDSLEDPHYFRNFYIRRTLRIFPLYYALFLLLLLITPFWHLLYSPLLWTYALYIGNLIAPLKLQQGLNIPDIYVLHHGASVLVSNIGYFWSLCVEEQFYLLWPVVVWWVRDRARLMQLCVLLCVLVILLRVYLYGHYNYFFLIYTSTYTRFDTLLVGAWMALWLRGRALSLRWLRRISLALSVPAIVVVIMILRLPRIDPFVVQHSRFVTTIGFTLIALAFAGLILRSLDDTSRVSRVLRWPPLHALGTISYGFYLIHLLIASAIETFAKAHLSWAFTAPILALAATLTLATLSFRYLETPFLRLKRTLAPQRSSEDPATPAHLHVSEPSV